MHLWTGNSDPGGKGNFSTVPTLVNMKLQILLLTQGGWEGGTKSSRSPDPIWGKQDQVLGEQRLEPDCPPPT